MTVFEKNDEDLKIKEMKDFVLSKYICCSGEIYKLLEEKNFQKLVKKIRKDKIELQNSVIYEKDFLTTEENFLLILDKYIGYVRDNYFIKHNELVFILSETLESGYSNMLLNEEYYHTNYAFYNEQFKKIFLDNLYQNTCYYGKNTENEYLKKAYNFLKEKNFDNDLKDIEDFFIKVINNRRDNLGKCFVLYKKIKEKKDYYLTAMEWLYEDYYEIDN